MFDSEKFWDRSAKSSAKQLAKEEESYIKLIKKSSKHLKSSDVVMDFACGTGVMSNGIADKVKKVHAIDISAGMIEVAQRRAVELKNTNVFFEKATIFDEKFSEESFDVIIAFNILHLVDANSVVKRIEKLLKAGGLFISTTACLGEKKSWWFIVFLFSKIGLVPTVRKFKTAELDEIITSNSFEIIDTKTLQLSTSNHYIVAKKSNY